jgi:hypothetical protein
MVLALIPKETPLESANVMSERRFEVVPAETRMFVRPPPPDGTETTTDPFVTPTEATPSPLKLKASMFCVPLLDWVVLPTAKREALTSVRATCPALFVQLAWALSEKERV